ncbi:MAG: MFS transporter [Acidimicrobiales bacterium]
MTRKLCPGPVDVPVLQRPRAAACRGTVAATLGYADMRRCLGYYATAGSARSLSAVPVATAIYAQTGSTSWVAAVTVARLVPFLLVSWLAGFVADRLDRRRTLAVMALGQALLLLALAGALMLSFDPAVTLAIISVSTVLTTPLFPTLASSLPHIVDDEDMICASVVLNGVETLSWVIGPALGGALLVVFDPVTVVAIGAIISLAGGWSIPQLRPNPGVR